MNYKNILKSVLLAAALNMTIAPADCQTAPPPGASQTAPADLKANGGQTGQVAQPPAKQPQPDKSAGENAHRRAYRQMLHLIRITVLVLILLMLIHNRRYSRRR